MASSYEAVLLYSAYKLNSQFCDELNKVNATDPPDSGREDWAFATFHEFITYHIPDAQAGYYKPLRGVVPQQLDT